MSKYFFIIVFLLTFLYSTGYTLKGGINYTVQSARVESFDNIKLQINIAKYKKFANDKNYNKNLILINKKTQNYKDRYITSYSNGAYTICYKSNIKNSYHYNQNGELIGISITQGKGFPSKRITYDSSGNFDSVTLDVSKSEQFIFDKNKKLVAHWIGKNCYNEQGELIMTRE